MGLAPFCACSESCTTPDCYDACKAEYPDAAEAFEHHGSGCDYLELQFGMKLNCVHYRLEPAVIRSIHKDDTNFTRISFSGHSD